MDRISFGKAVNLGYSDLEDMEYIGKLGGYEVYREDYDYGDYVGTAIEVSILTWFVASVNQHISVSWRSS